jgi:hypothetical protein
MNATQDATLTIETVKTLRNGQTLHHVTLKTADNTPVRCRVNGQVKFWKREPERFQIPVKYGLKHCFYITQDNVGEWAI